MNLPALPVTLSSRVLTWCMHALMAGLLALIVVRATTGDGSAAAVSAVAVLCGLAYAAGPALSLVRTSRRASAAWLALVCLIWLVLLVLSADAVWIAFPLYFLQLHLLPTMAGLGAVAGTAIAGIAGFAAHQDAFSPAMAIGPTLGAAVAVAVVWGYQALYRETERRGVLIDELTTARADLAEAQHTAGVLAERERLAREIHDTLAQGLTSIQLLLRAAERALPSNPDAAAQHIDQARNAAQDSLSEARRFVAALSPSGLEGSTLPDALQRLCDTTSERHHLAVRFDHGEQPGALPTAHEATLLRVAQSALANTIRHARAESVTLSLDVDGDHVVLDIADDGVGFDSTRRPEQRSDGTGFGLVTMRARVEDLGGTVTVRTSRGQGTRLTAQLPLPAVDRENTP